MYLTSLRYNFMPCQFENQNHDCGDQHDCQNKSKNIAACLNRVNFRRQLMDLLI